MDDIAIFPVTRLALAFEPGPWAFADERRAGIDAHFAQQVFAKPDLWNGRALLMRHWAVEGSIFRGAYFETDFASMLAWRDWGFPDPAVSNCFGMAALQAADGAYLLGEMAASTANAGRVYFPAGTPEPEDIVDGTVDLAGNVMRELAEETGVTAADLDVGEGWTCVHAGRRLAMMRPMRARENADALRARILAHLAREARPELSDIRIVRDPGDVDPRRMPPWIVAYFRHLWG